MPSLCSGALHRHNGLQEHLVSLGLDRNHSEAGEQLFKFLLLIPHSSPGRNGFNWPSKRRRAARRTDKTGSKREYSMNACHELFPRRVPDLSAIYGPGTFVAKYVHHAAHLTTHHVTLKWGLKHCRFRRAELPPAPRSDPLTSVSLFDM